MMMTTTPHSPSSSRDVLGTEDHRETSPGSGSGSGLGVGLASEEPKFGGFTRFEIELEFVNAISSPFYLMHLASLSSGSLLSSPAFIAYLHYLQYFTQPPYLKFLTYPGPSLKHLELLQNENFRRDCMSVEVVAMLANEDLAAVERWHRE